MARAIFDDEPVAKAYDKVLVRKGIQFVKPYWKLALVALIAMLTAATAAQFVPPYLQGYAIDNGVAKGDMHLLIMVAIAYVCSYLVYWIAQMTQARLVARLGEHVIYDIRHALFEHIQSQSQDFFDNREVGRIIARLTSDVNALNQLLTSGALTLVADAYTVIGIVIIMLRMNVKLTLLTFILLPFVVTATIIIRTRVRAAYREFRRKSATVTAKAAENISGVRAVKSFAREKENLKRFEMVNRESRNAHLHAIKVQSAFSPIMQVILVAALAMIYLYGGGQVRLGALTVGMILAFNTYIQRFFQPIRNISTFYQTVQVAMAGAERIFEILDTQPTVQDKPGATAMPKITGDVEFRDVTFAYGDTPILKGVSFTVKAGQTVALVGPTGAGKTTIINLLSRQYDIKGGQILIDGIDVRDVAMRSLRSQMGVVLQDSFLFHGSVKENIRYGKLDATDQEIESAAASIGVDEFINSLPKGFKTEIREGSTNISTGQKQLLSFARALLADPRILILDEATSSIDTQTELVIQDALRTLLKGRTSFVIAHRLSTIVEADLIMVIEGGLISERGTHEELLAKGGTYKNLYEAQFKFLSEDEVEVV